MTSRLDLLHVMKNSDRLEDIERRADQLYNQIHKQVLPKLTQSTVLSKQWTQAQQFVKELPNFASQWSQAVADEARLVRTIQELMYSFSNECCLQAELCKFQVRFNVNLLAETHLIGLEHVMKSICKCVKGEMGKVEQVWKQQEQSIRKLFELLKQIQTSLADQPSRLAQDMSNQLLLEQARFTEYVRFMELFHQEWFQASLWSISQCLLNHIATVIQTMGQRPSSLLQLLELYDRGN